MFTVNFRESLKVYNVYIVYNIQRLYTLYTALKYWDYNRLYNLLCILSGTLDTWLELYTLYSIKYNFIVYFV